MLNSSSECLISKTFKLHQRIPYRSKVIVKTMINTFSNRFNLVNKLATNIFFTKNLILCGLISRYRKNILKPNQGKKHYTSIFMPFYRHIVGIWILGNSVEHFSNDNNFHDLYQKKIKIFIKIQAHNVYFLKHLDRVKEFITVQKLLSKWRPNVIFQHIVKAI